MGLVLVSPEGDRLFTVVEDAVLVAGRELACALPILDPRVSRRHAEVRSIATGIEIRDLGSRNGTWINGKRIAKGHARVGDEVGFGGVIFRVMEVGVEPMPSPLNVAVTDASPTVVRERPMPAPNSPVADVAGQRLAQLVSSAQRLGAVTSVEAMLRTVVDDLLHTFAADRVAVMLPDASGALVPRIARDRRGGNVERAVPRGIVIGVAERKVALLTHDARDDARTTGETVIRQAVRSAMAAPLLGQGGVTLGVLYVDNLHDTHAFADVDLDYLVAYAGLAAVAAEREVVAARLLEASKIRQNFERYFTPQLAERIALEKGQVAQGGDRRLVVVLFSDIRGFTALAESLPAMEMAAQLNEYFEAMVDCVFRHHGALDKFIGDALMAYWGAPDAFADDSDRALAAAVEMQRELGRLNARWRRDGRAVLDIGIGVHRGEAFVGNIGSPRRLEYTLIGDTVNIANRLCANADRGVVLISDDVRSTLTRPMPTTARPDVVPERRLGAPVTVWSVDLPQ